MVWYAEITSECIKNVSYLIEINVAILNVTYQYCNRKCCEGYVTLDTAARNIISVCETLQISLNALFFTKEKNIIRRQGLYKGFILIAL